MSLFTMNIAKSIQPNFVFFSTSVCKRWNGLMSLFCLQMTTLFVYDFGIEYSDNSLHIDMKSASINESQLIRLAANTPNVRNLRINRPVVDFTTDGANRLAQLWPRVEELDLDRSRLNGQVMGNFTRHFPLLRRLKIDRLFFAQVELFDTIFSNHPNLVDFECTFWEGADSNWFRSCDVPLERFDVNYLIDDEATLNTLENCCTNSLQTIRINFGNSNFEKNTRKIHQIFSKFQQLKTVAFGFFEYSALKNQPILPRLENVCFYDLFGTDWQNLIEFFSSYPHLKKLRLEYGISDKKVFENLAAALPNLRSLSFTTYRLSSAGLMNFTALIKLESFSAILNNELIVEDVRAFVREMPSLQRLTILNLNESSIDFLALFKALRDDIRSSGSDRKLWVSRDDVLYFLLDSNDACTDQAIEKFVIEMKSKYRLGLRHC